MLDLFQFERGLFDQGIRHLAGVDEAGRGPLAGPVVAAAVMLPAEWLDQGLPPELKGLNDSKKLSASQRARYFEYLVGQTLVRHAIAEVSSERIDATHILAATHEAMNLALGRLDPEPEYALVDGLPVPILAFPQTAVVQGDGLSYSIAAASVLAKVSRDRQMERAHAQWPHYGFDKHKGYPTASHIAALRRHGPCPIHRRTFRPVREILARCFDNGSLLTTDVTDGHG